MIATLKTIEEIIEEFEDYIFEGSGRIIIYYKEIHWVITKDMIEFFGKTLEFKEIKNLHYTHEYDDWFFHKLWFDDFLDKDEFKII